MTAPRPNCRRWMWIELIGYDNTKPDYHVGAFLDNAGFIPDVVTFHLYTPDFIHAHEGFEREVTLPPDVCSYAGRPYNAERRRQQWTNRQFKGLIGELQQRGVKVYCSVMDAFQSHIDGKPYRSPWCDSHPEIWSVRHAGEESGSINPLKRFADGTYYEDFFVAKLRQVLTDYGFDGFHGADGISSPRRPIWMADYSDDMVGQFVETCERDRFGCPSGWSPADPRRIERACEVKQIVEALDLHCDGDPDRAEQRARYIWANLRLEWCEFYARRFGVLWRKICDTAHGLGKQVALNNAWTQEPFAAYYRYGIDYQRIARAGVDTFILETVGAGNEIGAEGVPRDLRADMNMMLLLSKAYLPDTPLTCLNATGDTTENWDVLNHAPPVCEREHYTLGSMFLQSSEGFEHASAGPVVCLADGINDSQWRWMDRNWQVAYEKTPTRVLGATIVWSEGPRWIEFNDYQYGRTPTRHRICTELAKRGAPLQSVISSHDLQAARGCLLVPRLDLVPHDLCRDLFAYDRGPLVIVSDDERTGLSCSVWRDGVQVEHFDDPSGPGGDLPEEMPEPPNYLHDLYFRPVSDEFLQRCADLLVELSGAPQVINGVTDARVLAYETEPGWVRLLIGSEAHYYIQPQIDLGREIEEVRIASHFPGQPIYPDGTTLSARVPPRGMVVLDVRVTER